MLHRFAPLAIATAFACPAQEAEVSTVDATAIRRHLAPVLAEHRIPGVVVGIVHGDQLVCTLALGHRDLESERVMAADTLFQIGSVTKSLTATLLGVLVDRGTVSFDDTLGERLPDAALPPPVAAITLRQLATHTSGLPRDPANRRNLPDSPSVMLPYSNAELVDALRTAAVEPSDDAAYSNFGYGVLGHALARAAGVDYHELLREAVLQPLGMTDSGITPDEAQESRLATPYWPEDDPLVPRPRWQIGEVASFGGAFSSAADLARLVAAQYGPASLLDDATRTALQTPHEDARVAGRRIAMGWFVDEVPGLGTLLGHGGEVDGYSAGVVALPGAHAGFVVLANTGGRAAERLIMTMMQHATAWLPAPR